MRRTADTKSKDTKNGDRAELLCAIAWLLASPEDMLVKSNQEDDIKKHIDWYVYKSNDDYKTITYDVKARRFEKYGKAFSADHHFIAEINNRQGISGSIYGKQGFMVHEVQGAFIWIARQLIVDEVETYVKPFGRKVDNMDAMYGNLYTSNKYDDGHVLTAFAFSEFKTRKLLIPDELLERQFEYTPEELMEYIVTNKLNVKRKE